MSRCNGSGYAIVNQNGGVGDCPGCEDCIDGNRGKFERVQCETCGAYPSAPRAEAYEVACPDCDRVVDLGDQATAK